MKDYCVLWYPFEGQICAYSYERFLSLKSNYCVFSSFKLVKSVPTMTKVFIPKAKFVM